MIQFGLRLHDSEALPLEERLKKVKSQGFSTVHLALSKIGLPSGMDERGYGVLTPGYAFYLKKIFADAGINIAIIGCYLNLGHPDETEWQRLRKIYRAHLRFARDLGCGMVGTETGAPNPTYSYDKESCHSREALEITKRHLSEVVSDAEKIGMTIGIEPVYKHIVWNSARAREVLDSIASPALQIIFDPVNLLHPDNLNERDEVISKAIEDLGDEVALIHLKDYVLKDNAGEKKMECLAPGLGEMDYSRILKFACEKKPFIQATLENTKPDNAEAARKFLEVKSNDWA
ncbi:MAG: sugar phosphate isomerase/epimerase [Lachnospiraceae bacterium]|nr:sugar phosphate isomerase/epimerase [Lachnospiraceae bacterium]